VLHFLIENKVDVYDQLIPDRQMTLRVLQFLLLLKIKAFLLIRIFCKTSYFLTQVGMPMTNNEILPHHNFFQHLLWGLPKTSWICIVQPVMEQSYFPSSAWSTACLILGGMLMWFTWNVFNCNRNKNTLPPNMMLILIPLTKGGLPSVPRQPGHLLLSVSGRRCLPFWFVHTLRPNTYDLLQSASHVTTGQTRP